MGSSALFAAFIALVVTVVVSDGLTIDGLSTWIFATVIVWGASLAATLLLPVLVFKSLREEKGRQVGSTCCGRPCPCPDLTFINWRQ